jgi:ubiquitin-activating enzyme E1
LCWKSATVVEKENEWNCHIDFIVATIRAVSYSIQPQGRFEIKKIAGNIISAIATTAAMICGFGGT